MKYRFFPNKAQAFWGQELLNSQGISAKIGQILSQGKDAELPKSSITISAAKNLFQKSFGLVPEIQTEALAASMGQVFCVSLNGKTYALKILHPGIKTSLKKEIKNILLLGTYFAKAKKVQLRRADVRAILE